MKKMILAMAAIALIAACNNHEQPSPGNNHDSCVKAITKLFPDAKVYSIPTENYEFVVIGKDSSFVKIVKTREANTAQPTEIKLLPLQRTK